MDRSCKRANRRNIIAFWAVILIASAFLIRNFYLLLPGEIDDYGTMLAAHLQIDMGRSTMSFRNMLNPYFFNVLITNLLYGMHDDSYVVAHMIWYGLGIITSFYLACRYIETGMKKWIMIFLLFFMLIPGAGTNRFHMAMAFATLLFLICIEKARKREKTSIKGKITLGVLIICTFLLGVFSADFLLVGLYILIPVICYMLLSLWQNKKTRKWIYCAFCFMAVCLCGIKILNMALARLGIHVFGEFQGYGGAEYAYWNTPSGIFEQMGILLDTALKNCNINLTGGFLQFQSGEGIIRLVLWGIAACIPIKHIIIMVRKGVEKVDPVDALASLCIVISVAVNLFNGYNNAFPGTIGRYLSVVWYLLPILLVREFARHLKDEKFEIKIGRKSLKFSKYFCLLIGIVFLCVEYLEPPFRDRSDYHDDYAEVIEYLDNNDAKYGLGNVEAAHPITTFSEDEHLTKWSRYNYPQSDFLIKNDYYIEDYFRGANIFNFLVVGMDIPEERITGTFGAYLDRMDFFKYDCTVYLFDHDIRWKVKHYENDGEQIIQPIELPLGINRVSLKSANIDSVSIEIPDMIPEIEIKDIQYFEDRVDYIIENQGNPREIGISLFNLQSQDSAIESIDVTTQRAAIDLLNEETILGKGQDMLWEETFEPGEYMLTVQGNNLDDIALESQNGNKDIISQEIVREKNCHIYKMQISDKEVVKLMLRNEGKKDITIESLTYEIGREQQKNNFAFATYNGQNDLY